VIAGAVALFGFRPACAAYVSFEDVGRSWYRDSGYTEGLTNPNYLAGECTVNRCDVGNDGEYRNFFVFYLPPIDRVITSASLRLWLPEDGFVSPTGSETYQLFDVATPPYLLGRRWGVDTFTDLGTGRTYGAYTATEADEHTLIEITLNAAALADLNAALGLFAFGGAVTTLDAEVNDEEIFARSGYQHARLVLELAPVPLPGAAWLLSSGFLVLCGCAWNGRAARD
jgi:hypothetical protein